MAAEETGGSVCREAVMGGERADPEAAAVLLLRRSGPPQDEPPRPGRPPGPGATAVVCTLRFFPRALSSPLCGASTQRDPPGMGSAGK